MKDLTDPFWIKLKGMLFLAAGCMSVALLLMEYFSQRTLFLLGLSIWSFCRFYYFAFYVIQHYVDPSFKFAGLLDFTLYMVRQRGKR